MKAAMQGNRQVNRKKHMQLSSRFTEALVYATALHAEQQRKISGEPYLAHLLAVSALVMEYGGTEDEAIAALLHDAAEDQGGRATLAEIHHRFGAEVADIVESCSDTFVTPKPPWHERKEAFIARLHDATVSVQRVTAADKLHNARSIMREYRRQGEAVWQCFRGGREGTLWYFRAVIEALRQAGNGPLVEELDRAVRELEQLVEGKD